jgi:hypothetical protein
MSDNDNISPFLVYFRQRPFRSILTLMVLGAGNVAVPLSLLLPAFTLIRRDVTEPRMSSWEGTDRDL